jgi:hypothetical protein
MTDLTPNIPEVVAEVRALFERYEQALIDKDVAVLDATFWNSPHTIRYALNEHGYGFDEIHAHRVARPPGPGIKERRTRLEILTLGRLGALSRRRLDGHLRPCLDQVTAFDPRSKRGRWRSSPSPVRAAALTRPAPVRPDAARVSRG